MDDFRIPVGTWIESGVDWIKDNLDGLLDVISFVMSFLVDGLTRMLLTPHFRGDHRDRRAHRLGRALVAARDRNGRLLRPDRGDGSVGPRHADPCARARRRRDRGADRRAAGHLVGTERDRARGAQARARLHADHAGVRVPDPGDRVLRHRVVPGLVANRDLRAAPGRATDRARHPRCRLRDRRGRTRVRCQAGSDPARHPAPPLRCRPSWPASTRSSCSPCRWRSSPEWRVRTASGRWWSRRSRPSTSPRVSRPVSASC